MTLSDLTDDQRLELKMRIVEERNEQRGERTSYAELASADDLVSDEDLEARYEGTEFSSDDFSCGVAADREGVLDDLKKWAERELLIMRYAKQGTGRRPTLEAKLGIDWARKALLDHIEAIEERGDIKKYRVFIERTEKYFHQVVVSAKSAKDAESQVKRMDACNEFEYEWNEHQPGVETTYEAVELKGKEK